MYRIFFMTFLISILLLIIAILAINYLQNNYIDTLPNKLKTWEFLPIYLRSLKPYDDLIVKYLCFGNLCSKIIDTSKSNTDNNVKYLKGNNNDNNIKIIFENNAYVTESF